MATHPIPLAVAPTARGWAKSIGTSAKDAQIINGLIESTANPLLSTKNLYVSKRAGSTTNNTIASGISVFKFYGTGFAQIGSSSSALYRLSDGTNLGTLTSFVKDFTNDVVAEGLIDGNSVLAFVTNDSEGWFLFEDAIGDNFPTFTGNRTSGSAVITGISNTAGIYKGQALSGTGIQGSTRVLSVDSSTQITMDKVATSGAATATTITKEAVALITDTNFPSGANSMVFLDGYFQVGTNGGKIHQSAINDPSTYSAGDYVTADCGGEGMRFIFKSSDYIGAAGIGTIQYFANVGNPTGSVLSAQSHLNVTGLQLISAPVFFSSGGYCIAQDASNLVGLGKMGLYRLTGVNNFSPVSDDVTSSIITDGSMYYVGMANSSNKNLVLVYGASSATFPVYDPATGSTTFFSLPTAIKSSFGRYFTRASTSDTFLWATGNTWTDSSSAYTLTIQTEPQDMNNGMDTSDDWVGLLADVESTGTATLDVSDDDYATWVNKGSFDMTKVKKRIHNLAVHNLRAYRIQHSANTGFRGQLLRIKHTPSNA